MSIYATIGSIWLEDEYGDGDLVEVYLQAVPGHIDYPSEGIWEWLPPPVEDDALRAVYFCAPWTSKGTERNGQEYINPLLVLTGAEYHEIRFVDLWDRLNRAIEVVLAEFSAKARKRLIEDGKL